MSFMQKNRYVVLFTQSVLLLMLSFSENAYAEGLATGKSLEAPIGRLVIGLAVCIFLAYAIILVLRKILSRQGSGGKAGIFSVPGFKTGRRITVIETKRLNANADISLFASGEREYLVLITSQQALLLHEETISLDTATDLAGTDL